MTVFFLTNQTHALLPTDLLPIRIVYEIRKKQAEMKQQLEKCKSDIEILGEELINFEDRKKSWKTIYDIMRDNERPDANDAYNHLESTNRVYRYLAELQSNLNNEKTILEQRIALHEIALRHDDAQPIQHWWYER
jgi:hypothetical protein